MMGCPKGLIMIAEKTKKQCLAIRFNSGLMTRQDLLRFGGLFQGISWHVVGLPGAFVGVYCILFFHKDHFTGFWLLFSAKDMAGDECCFVRHSFSFIFSGIIKLCIAHGYLYLLTKIVFYLYAQPVH